MITAVTDARSNPNDQIAHAATVLRRSDRLQKIFNAICKGGVKAKTVDQLMKKTGYGQVAVLQLAGKLADQQLVHKIKLNGETVYDKDRFYATNRAKIMRYATKPNALKTLATKYHPKGSAGTTIIRIPARRRIQAKVITCDDFDQFSKVKKVKDAPKKTMSERAFKQGIQKLIGEGGLFQDWGGEPNDLYTTKLTYKGKRRAIAFAFKGPGTTGVLTPRKLGKNGDQIQRLFVSPAEIFVVQS